MAHSPCVKCGKDLPAEARFCTGCGAEVVRAQADPKTTVVHNVLLAVIAALLLVLLIQGFV